MKRKRLPKAIRREVFELYNGCCAFCDEKRVKWLQVHHRDGDWHNNELDNLMLVCIFDHAMIFHPEKADEMIEWWIKRMKINDIEVLSR